MIVELEVFRWRIELTMSRMLKWTGCDSRTRSVQGMWTDKMISRIRDVLTNLAFQLKYSEELDLINKIYEMNQTWSVKLYLLSGSVLNIQTWLVALDLISGVLRNLVVLPWLHPMPVYSCSTITCLFVFVQLEMWHMWKWLKGVMESQKEWRKCACEMDLDVHCTGVPV